MQVKNIQSIQYFHDKFDVIDYPQEYLNWKTNPTYLAEFEDCMVMQMREDGASEAEIRRGLQQRGYETPRIDKLLNASLRLSPFSIWMLPLGWVQSSETVL